MNKIKIAIFGLGVVGSHVVKLLEKNIWDEKLLRELVDTMSEASICGLGQAAGNPITCSTFSGPTKYRPSPPWDSSVNIK